MKRTAINPDKMYDALQYHFSHAVESEGQRYLHLAGQVAIDNDGNPVWIGDLAAQTRQCCENIRSVLESVGATPANIVRTRVYIVDHEPSKLDLVEPVVGELFDGIAPAASTLIGVQALAQPIFLVEVEATAVL